jgi:hypothetical protein
MIPFITANTGRLTPIVAVILSTSAVITAKSPVITALSGSKTGYDSKIPSIPVSVILLILPFFKLQIIPANFGLGISIKADD